MEHFLVSKHLNFINLCEPDSLGNHSKEVLIVYKVTPTSTLTDDEGCIAHALNT